MSEKKEAWLLSAEGKAWRKTMDKAVSDGLMPPALRDAVLHPEVVVPLDYHRHIAQTLATAIADAGKRAGIIDPDYHGFSVPQLLHILDCLVDAKKSGEEK